MTRYQAAKRRATWLVSAVTALTFLLFFLAILPAIGGRITSEQPVPTYRR